MQLGHEKIKWVEDKNIHVTLKFLVKQMKGEYLK